IVQGAAYKEQANHPDVEREFRLAADAAEKAGNPSRYAQSLSLLAGILQIRGKYDEAEKLILHALAIVREHPGKDGRDLATGLTNLADLYCSRGRFFEAERLCLEALEIEKKNGVEGRHMASTLEALGEVQSSLGRNSEAIGALRRALAMDREILGANHILLAR